MWAKIGKHKINIEYILSFSIIHQSEESKKANGHKEATCYIVMANIAEPNRFIEKFSASKDLTEDERLENDEVWNEVLVLGSYLGTQLI